MSASRGPCRGGDGLRTLLAVPRDRARLLSALIAVRSRPQPSLRCNSLRPLLPGAALAVRPRGTPLAPRASRRSSFGRDAGEPTSSYSVEGSGRARDRHAPPSGQAHADGRAGREVSAQRLGLHVCHHAGERDPSGSTTSTSTSGPWKRPPPPLWAPADRQAELRDGHTRERRICLQGNRPVGPSR
jgi:hypothetical protein